MAASAKASRDFQIFAKPAGAVCNLDCRYCYYLSKEALYPETRVFRMEGELLEDYIAQQIAMTPGPEVLFSWHGGEPTILGLDWFRHVVETQRKHRPAGKRITNSIQTNGVLLNEDWCRFLAEEKFGVGLSLDGPPALHDGFRRNKEGQATHRQVMRAYRLLRQQKVPVDLLCVVHAQNAGRPLEVYRFFREIEAQYISFIPLVEPQAGSPGGVSERTPAAKEFGSFLCAVFDQWVRRDIGRVIVQVFEEAARPPLGLDHSLCIFRPTCGDVPVVEHNGDFYCCDHFVDNAHRLGNIRHTPLRDLLESQEQHAFGRAKQETLPRWCRECPVLDMCHGGCPKDRIIAAPDGEPGLNYLCEGYRAFFHHCRPYLERMAALRRAGQPPETLMEQLRLEEAAALPKAGRNDPCPCGSGRKYKKCCLRM